MTKWIGGATAAIVLAFAGATFAGELLANDEPRLEAAAVSLDNAIPVDEAAIADHASPTSDAGEPTMISQPQIQPISAAMQAADQKACGKTGR